MDSKMDSGGRACVETGGTCTNIFALGKQAVVVFTYAYQLIYVFMNMTDYTQAFYYVENRLQAHRSSHSSYSNRHGFPMRSQSKATLSWSTLQTHAHTLYDGYT